MSFGSEIVGRRSLVISLIFNANSRQFIGILIKLVNTFVGNGVLLVFRGNGLEDWW